jgi:8-oxo-dGTP pyrophosphatase MutT (NUDIX family)
MKEVSTAIVAISHEGKILILKRGETAPWMPGKWSLVGGVVEKGEDPEEAVKRECEEEIGRAPKNLKYVKTIATPDIGDIHYFSGEISTDKINLDSENSAYEFVSQTKVEDYEYVPYVQEFLEEQLQELNESFVLKGEERDRVVVFDLDDTLVKTDAKIKVLSRETGKVIKTLTPEEFNFYIASPGKFLSFEEFEDPEILRQGKFISGVIKKLLSYHRRKIPVAIVTARSNTKLVRDFFAERGINIHKDLVIAVNDPSQGLTGSIAERKLEALRRLYEMGLEHFTFFDDNEDNLRLAKELEKTGADVELIKVEGEVPRKFRG